MKAPYPFNFYQMLHFTYRWLTSHECNAVAIYASAARIYQRTNQINRLASCLRRLRKYSTFELSRRRSPVAFQLSHLTWKYLVIRSHCGLFEVGPSVFGFRGGTRGPGT